MNRIEWWRVGDAIDFYHECGYTYVEAPWAVSKESIDVTCPRGARALEARHPYLTTGYLVGSAEQSFIELMCKGDLGEGLFVAAGPCWRDNAIDKYHHRYFFKVELIATHPRAIASYNPDEPPAILHAAKDYMEKASFQKLEAQRTREGWDLFLNGIEVGSYGIRSYRDFTWIYGTGLALPRFNQALETK